VSIFYQFKIQEGVINLKQDGRSKKHLRIGQDFSDYGDSGDYKLPIDGWCSDLLLSVMTKTQAPQYICREAMPIRQMARRSTNNDSLNIMNDFS
jgi:hypothetical protein